MKEALFIAKEKLGKAYIDLEFLLKCFEEVLVENNEEDMIKYIPWINDYEINDEIWSIKIIKIYSIAFQLLNMVEENGAVQTRRKIEDGDTFDRANGLWANSLKLLKEQGIGEKEISERLHDIRIEPVLTAHPTEAKRSTVLEHHRDLYLLLVKRENKMYTSHEQQEIKREVKLIIGRLWKTSEIFIEKPDVLTELRNVLYYLTNVFPTVVPLLDRRLYMAWDYLGYDKSLIKEAEKLPRLSFGNWVGGDRDGHPLVTDQVTKEALTLLRLNAFVVVRRKLLDLIKNLSFDVQLEDTDQELINRVSEIVEEIGESAKFTLERNEGEAFRQFLALMIHKLPLNIKREHATEIKENPYSYTHDNQLIEDLKLLRSSLDKYGAKAIGYTDVNEAIRIVQVFGFHLAKLDIRQNSTFHDKAFSQLMNAASLNGDAFLTWKEEERVKFINSELSSNRPFTHDSAELDENAKAVVDCYRVITGHVNKYGVNGIGSLIVSMTRTPSDLLLVYLLAREAGLTTHHEGEIVCKLPVVPLLETIEDLQNGPHIMDEFLSHPYTQRSLKYIKEIQGEEMPIQQIMVGYSDSNKDGGILSSQWNLYLAQSKLDEVGKKHGVKIRFFHGKGGSISRGAGPTHWFIKALPHSSVNGDLRLTEQGETIAQKYANKLNATYNLELLLSGTASSTIIHEHTNKEDHPFADILLNLAEDSKNYYRKLITHENFIKFFSEATPIDAIENSKIGSRPARRTGRRSLEDLRAIPWVFSWAQSRFNMTSWYGIGSALEKFKNEQPEKFEEFKKATSHDPLIRYVLTNVDTSLAASDESIMREYASLVSDDEVRNSVLDLFINELEKTRSMLDDVLEKPFADRRVNHYYSNLVRAEAMVPLHKNQVSLLRKWRKIKDNDSKESENTLLSLLFTVNAIASAMRNTG